MTSSWSIKKDETMLWQDALSWVMAHLRPEAVQAILDGATVGTSQRAERENPAIIEGDQQLEKEVWVTTG